MTKFTGPLIVGMLDSDTTAATIETSGTAVLRGLEVSGPTVFNSRPALVSGATVSGTATFQVSPRDQLTGKATFVAQATLVQSNTTASRINFRLPSGANLVNFYIDVEQPFETAAGATAAAVRLSAVNVTDGNLAEIPVSASGRYSLDSIGAGGYAGNAEAFRNITASLQAWVSIQGSSTAMSAGQAMLSVVYVV